MATTAEQLTRQTETLRSLVNQFKLKEDISRPVVNYQPHFEKATHNGAFNKPAMVEDSLVEN